MVKLLMHAGRCSGRYLALAALTTTLVACGGSSGDDDSTTGGGADFDNDGIPDSEDSDADGDDIEDLLDPFVDLDNDGFDDVIGEQDLDGDLIANKDDSDADGDGLDDFAMVEGQRLDRFIDLNGDDLDDATGLREGPANFDTITEDAPCGGESGSDAYSVNANWDDNCLIRRSNVIGEGQFADSLYAVGVQRIVFCSGFGGTDTDTYATFADGEYGPLSEQAMQQFQASEPDPISDDGQVGPQSWSKLQSAITRLSAGEVVNGATTDVYGFDEGRCAGIPLFYQSGALDEASQTIVQGGWRLVKNAPSTESIPFSIDPPFGRLD
ncbi:MAG: hypothetical protein AB8B87_12320 [Granulosicoccus sp.]